MAARHLQAVDPRCATGSVEVVIADHHVLIRRSLRRLLQATPGLRVVGEAADLAAASQQVAAHHPDVLVLGLNMPDGSSLGLVEALRERAPDTHVVVMSVEDAPGFARRSLQAGASGFVVKQNADSELPAAVDAAVRDQRYVSPGIAERLARIDRASRTDQ